MARIPIDTITVRLDDNRTLTLADTDLVIDCGWLDEGGFEFRDVLLDGRSLHESRTPFEDRLCDLIRTELARQYRNRVERQWWHEQVVHEDGPNPFYDFDPVREYGRTVRDVL